MLSLKVTWDTVGLAPPVRFIPPPEEDPRPHFRLLRSLRDAGVHAWAAVLQEQAAWPTPGRTALERAGVRVLAAPDATTHDAQTTVRAVLEAVERKVLRREFALPDVSHVCTAG